MRRLVVLVALAIAACSASAQEYEICRANARVRFHADAETCADEACIKALSEREADDLRSCR